MTYIIQNFFFLIPLFLRSLNIFFVNLHNTKDKTKSGVNSSKMSVRILKLSNLLPLLKFSTCCWSAEVWVYLTPSGWDYWARESLWEITPRCPVVAVKPSWCEGYECVSTQFDGAISHTSLETWLQLFIFTSLCEKAKGK